MNFTVMVVAALAVGLFDRCRGSDAGSTIRAICTLLSGSILTMLAAGEYTPFAMVGAFLWWLGEKPGWGTPMGMYSGFKPKPDHSYERWQIGDTLKKNYRLAVAVRGLMWGAPMLLLYQWMPTIVVVPLAMMCAFPIACELAERQRHIIGIEPTWLVEILRGSLCAAFVVLLSTQVVW